MPQGPGDDILDALEAGTADDAVMSKYKIDANKLKAFKSLYYGLTEDDMRYEDIGEYYPELNDYFKPSKPLAPEARPQEPVASSQPPTGDPFKLIKERERLNKKLATVSTPTSAGVGAPAADLDQVANEKYRNQIQSINAELTALGYNPDELAKDVGDLPDLENFDTKHALTLKKDNPLAFDRYKAAIKSQYGLLHAVDKAEGPKAANQFMNAYLQSQYAPDYESQRAATKEAVAAIYKYERDSGKQSKILADLIRDKSFGYGIGLPGAEEAIMNDPRSANMNPYQVAAIQFLEDTDPPSAQAFDRLLNFSPDEVKAQAGNASFIRGFESKGRELENIGLNIMSKSLQEKMTNMMNNKANWKQADAEEFKALYDRYETLTKDVEGQRERYPSAAAMDADQQMQDAMGSTHGVGAKTLLGIGENADDFFNWIGGLIKAPFLNNKESALDDLMLYGDKKLAQLSQYETEGEELFGRQFKRVFEGPLKDKIDQIKQSNLTDEEKRLQVTQAILADNRQNIKFVPNDKAGKVNFTAKTVLNAVSNVASELVPQIALAMLTGGGATATKARQLISLFGSTFATAYNDYYYQAIERNIAHPSQYAIVNTTIEAASELITNDVARARRMFSGKLAGQLLEGATEASMQALRKTGRFAAMKAALKATGKDMFKSAAAETYEEVVGQAAMNLTGKHLFNEDIDFTDDLLQTAVSTFVGMFPLGGAGAVGRFREANQMQKYALYEAGMNPDKFLERVQQDLKAGVITADEAQHRIAIIEQAAKVASKINVIKSDDTVLTDNEKADLLVDELDRDSLREQTKDATATEKENLKSEIEKVEKGIDEKLKPTKEEVEPAKQPEGGTTAETTEPVATGTQDVDVIAPATEQTWIDPTTDRQYIMRDGKLYTILDGKEVAFSDKAMQSKHVKDVVSRMQAAQKVPDNIDDIAITSEEDLDAALQKFAKPTMVEQQGSINNQDNAGVLPKLSESTPGKGVAINNDITTYTPQSIIEKAREIFKGDPLIERVSSFLDPLIKANPNIRIEHDAQLPGNVYGFSFPDGRVQLNFGLHQDEGALLKTGLHELMHAVTRFEIDKNSAFRSELDSVLSTVREKMGLPDSDAGVNMAINLLSARGNLDENLYGAANAHEMIAELFTNKAFRDKLAAIEYEGDSLLKKIFLTIAKYLSEVYKNIVGAKAEITADNLADYLMDLTERTVTGRQGIDQSGALPSTVPQSQEDAIKAIIKATPKSITDEKLKERIVAATGIDAATVQDLIDEVRKPNVPLDPNETLSTVRQKEMQVAVNKFRKLREKQKSNEPNWWQRQWEGIRNGSAWTDNPFRFVTKITEDINKAYGLRNNEAIPLGRQFEKSAIGRAVLKVDSFINEVIRGNIGNEKLGRLKGEKYTDFLDYLAAKRVIDRLHTQQDKQLAGEDVSRQTGNVIRKDAGLMLLYLQRKYGNMKEFEKRADALQRHMDGMLKELTAAGMISKETYDQIKADNEFYAPFSVVQSKVYADQPKQSVGIDGVVKRIKGVDYQLLKSNNDELRMIDALGGALEEGIITPEEYFSTALSILKELKEEGKITEEEYNKHISTLENPGFAINDILDAAANMIYKAQGMILKNTMLQRLYGYKAFDTEGLFIQDVEGFTPVTRPDGTVVMAPKPLNSIKVEPGMGAIKMRVDGKEKFVAVNKHAADKLTVMNNYETATILKVSDFVNRIFRGIVITISPGFQVRNFLIDFFRTAMLSRYGPIAGKGLVEPFVNFAMYIPQYIEALLHSALGNVNIKTNTYKQWMQSDSYSKGMFDNLFDNEKRIKEVNAPLAKRILNNLINLRFITVPGSILEQTHKIATHQRGASVEGFKPEMFTALWASKINGNIKPNMTAAELKDATDKLNYEVQNDAGSPNFTQTHRWMKMASIFLQFFSARVKGEMTDYRRLLNMFGMTSAEGVKLSAQERAQLLIQFFSITGAITAFAILNNADDDDEKEFDSISPFHRDNYMNIPLGYFEYVDEDGRKYQLRDYAKVPLRGLSATINVMANSFVKYYKRQNPEEFKKMALAFAGNASPVNLNGSDMREYGESLTSNLTPLFKFFIEYSFNRDTHNHRNVIPDFVQGRGMLSKYRAGDLKPWDVFTPKTPQWAIDLSKYLYDSLGIEISAIELDHMENTMGNPTELYQKALKKSLFRSESKFPLYESPEETKNTSSTTATPVIE